MATFLLSACGLGIQGTCKSNVRWQLSDAENIAFHDFQIASDERAEISRQLLTEVRWSEVDLPRDEGGLAMLAWIFDRDSPDNGLTIYTASVEVEEGPTGETSSKPAHCLVLRSGTQLDCHCHLE